MREKLTDQWNALAGVPESELPSELLIPDIDRVLPYGSRDDRRNGREDPRRAANGMNRVAIRVIPTFKGASLGSQED